MSSETYETKEELQAYVLEEFDDLYDRETVAGIFQASEALLEDNGSVSEEKVEDVVVNLEEYMARYGLR